MVTAAPASRRRLVSSINWTLIDQALSSGTNFLLAIVVVRSVSAPDFGTFSIVVIAYVMAVGLTRAVTTEPLTVRFGGDDVAIMREAPRCLGTALAVGLALGAASLLTATVMPPTTRAALVILGVAFPLLLLQDAGRVICFARNRAKSAAINDGLWAVSAAVLVAVVLTLDDPPVGAYVAAWFASGCVAGLAILWQLRIRPSLREVNAWVRSSRDLGVPLFSNFLLTTTPPYLLFALTPLVASLGVLGLARSAYVPFGPFGVVLQGAWLLLLPMSARRSRDEIVRLAVVSSLTLGALASIWGAIVCAAIPSGFGETIFGSDWSDARSERLIFAIALIAQALGTGPLIALRAMERPGSLVRVRLASAPVVLGGGLLLAAAHGAIGVAVAIALGDVMTTALSWRTLRSGTVEGNRAPAHGLPTMSGVGGS